jgi:hypothetical protein
VAEGVTIAKVTFDSLKDFKFMAAYEAYSKSFDSVEAEEDRIKLNELISKLSIGEISYGHFYRENSEYQQDSDGRGYRRARIQTSRKRDYRRDQMAKERNKRHKK